MNEQAENTKDGKRRWLKYSLRTFLLAVTVLCVWLGFIVNRANQQKQAVAWVRGHGGKVFYDYEGDGESVWRIKNAQPPGPAWLRERMGIDYFADAGYVALDSPQIDDLAPLAALTGLTNLHLEGSAVSDLRPLADMQHLRWLYLENTQVSDLSPLAGMTEMQGLDLSNTPVSDLSPLVRMKQAIIWLGQDQQVTIPLELKSQVRRK